MTLATSDFIVTSEGNQIGKMQLKENLGREQSSITRTPTWAFNAF